MSNEQKPLNISKSDDMRAWVIVSNGMARIQRIAVESAGDRQISPDEEMTIAMCEYIAALEQRLAVEEGAEKQPIPEEYGLEGTRLDYALEAARLFKENLRIKATQQAAIDAALERAAQRCEESPPEGALFAHEIRKLIGTNPLAEAQAKIAELESTNQHLKSEATKLADDYLQLNQYYVGAKEQIAELEQITEPCESPCRRGFELITQLAEAQVRIAELEQMVVTEFDMDYPPTFRQGIPDTEQEELVTAERCTWLVGRITKLERKLEQARKDADSYKSQLNQVLIMTMQLDKHPEGYDGPCACKLCQSHWRSHGGK